MSVKVTGDGLGPEDTDTRLERESLKEDIADELYAMIEEVTEEVVHKFTKGDKAAKDPEIQVFKSIRLRDLEAARPRAGIVHMVSCAMNLL